jgi:peptidoglycan hydrolase-like protein with peptidoglycan-binding domain
MTSARVLPQYYKHIRFFAVTFALLMVYAVLPMPARAAEGLTDAQIQAVTNLLASFNTDQAMVAKVEATLRGNDSAALRPTAASVAMPGASACGMLERNLKRGSTGEDVSALQQFLQKTGDFAAASTTDFFGPATEKALQQWQARMGVVNQGDSDSTGFGALGPKTREMIAMHCNPVGDQGGQAGPSPATSSAQPAGMNAAPVCTLRASKNAVQSGEQVTLTWESKNATWASSVSGDKGPVRGSITVSPTETMTYLKRVYGPGGEGQCTTTVTVGDDATPTAEVKVVIASPSINVGQILSLMGSGMAAVMDGYLSLFGMSLGQY